MSSSPTPDTARPATKRVRSDHDHSKASTKASETTRENGHSDHPDSKESNHEDVDWLKEAPFFMGKSREGWTTKWRESCWCGKTAFVYDEDPLQVKICHCEDCQRLHGAPFQQAAVFHKKNVRLDSGPEFISFLSAHGEVHPISSTPSPLPRKISCKACGSPLMDEGKNMIMAFPPCFEFARTHKEVNKSREKGEEISGAGEGRKQSQEDGNGGEKKIGLPDAFKPSSHIFYERRLFDIKDGLVKWRGHKEESEKMGEEEK
ncbi:hypothetical protein CI109_102500 [Kwoniella shandongensis]|uniref:CENP-V/GFA domain-containing protein n=1 Tax=Kwoniella shandongensis TaxID=1734106 RepID=A0AAJ8MWA2_9TREE